MDENRRATLKKMAFGGLAGTAMSNGARASDLDDGGRLTYSAPFLRSAPRALMGRLSDVLSVGDFGARGDGRTDDTAAFQNAADAAASSGKALFVPATPRGYLVTDTIQVRCRRLYGEADHIDQANRGTFVVFKPSSISDMKPCFAIVDGMYGAGLVENISVWGTQAFSLARPADWVDPSQLPNYSAFSVGLCAFGVYGQAQPTFRNVATKGVKVGLYLDSTDGHVSSYDCGWNGLFGVYCRRNSEDYFFLGGKINGIFSSVVFGTFSHANHTGGMNITMYRVHMGYSPYGFYQVKDAEFQGRALALSGRLDEVRFEATGEAVFQFLPESITDSLRVDSFGFSWARIYRGYPNPPDGWSVNLPPEVLPYDQQQQFALRFGALAGNVKLGWLGGSWPLRRSANATKSGGIALIERMYLDDKADLSALGDDYVLKTPPSPGSWTRRRNGPPANKMDLTLDADVAPAVNLLKNPEDTANWILRGASAPNVSLSAVKLVEAGHAVPLALLEELGTTPVILKVEPKTDGGSFLSLPLANANLKIDGRSTCLTLWIVGGRVRIRFAIGKDRFLYDETYQVAEQWAKVVCVDQTSGELVPSELHVFSEDARTYFLCGVMACLDAPKPYTSLNVPRLRYGLALEDAKTTTAAPVEGAGAAPPSAPAGYVTVRINGVDRQIAYY